MFRSLQSAFAKRAVPRVSVFRRALTSESVMHPPSLAASPSKPLTPVSIGKRPKEYSVKEADDLIGQYVKSDSRVYLHMAAGTPQRLGHALGSLIGKVKNVEVCHMHVEGNLPHLKPEALGSFRDNSFFMGANVRKAVNEGRADYSPAFFSEMPLLFRRGITKLDTALISVSPPDKHGWMSMGVSVDCSLAAVQTAKNVICQVNKHMPRTHGDGMIHVSQVSALLYHDEPLPEHAPEAPSEVVTTIGKNVASLVPDGACLQLGIGGIPDATLSQLKNHKHLGIHSEMFSDGVLDLVKSGVVDGHFKHTHPRKLVATFLIGTRKLYDFVDDNPNVAMLDVQYVNDPYVISRNPNVHAINSAIEVDLTGQVVADSIGTRFYSGVGGQMDFMRGAAVSEGGKPIIALPSRAGNGESRIVPFLKQGAGVVTTRAHVHYVVTEYGVAYLYGRSVRERAIALANIAHPDHRPALFAHIKKQWGPLLAL